ncbi:MAG: MFS transporter [Sandaracinaceae bacterium]
MGRDALRRALTLTVLVLSGESIYLLPYALRRDYSGTLIDVLDLGSEASLGAVYSFYGALNVVAYLLGGWLADVISPRVLLPLSLTLTAAGGAWLAAGPTSAAALYGLFALWSFSTILTFWAALVKATRSLGGSHAQGRAFGALDGGRGLVAAAAASVGVVAFAWAGEGAAGLRAVIALYAGLCLVAAVGSGLVLEGGGGGRREVSGSVRARLYSVMGRPRVWLLGGIIFCAYSAFYGTYYVAGFARVAYGQSDTAAAALSANVTWIRALTPWVAGVVADRLSTQRVVAFAFAVLIATFASMALLPPAALPVLAAQAAVVGAAVFALHGVYYALLAEGGLPRGLTGTAVGLVALIGYAPDVLTPYLWGRLLDAFPGALGYRLLFGSLGAAAGVGLLLTALHRPAPASPNEHPRSLPA